VGRGAKCIGLNVRACFPPCTYNVETNKSKFNFKAKPNRKYESDITFNSLLF
jgi:hypothetical protein